MGLLQRVSIKNFLMGIVGILILVLTLLSANNVLKNYRDSREMMRVDIANEMSDEILEGSGHLAKERGVTALALSSNSAADGMIVQKIRAERQDGNEHFKKSIELGKELAELDSSNALLKSYITKAESLYSELESARRSVDQNLERDTKNYPPKEWIKLITSFIDANADLRLSTFMSSTTGDTMQEALRMNLELKQAVWLISEYAGRERATLGNFINNRQPVDAATIEKLNTFKAIVDLNLKSVLRLKEADGVDPKVLESISNMENIYLGRFGEVRKGVYEAMATGEYPVNGKEWVERSSEGINSILEVSASLGKMVDDKVMPALATSRRNMVLSIIVLVFILGLGAFTVLVINRKVISPMQYLNETMNQIEKTGDLSLKLNITSKDESGQMAETFNKMMDKLHDIIKDIHTSSELLASSSEELSASAVQIAGGSETQSQRASQVSTAAQEMSATIIEVVKNVAGAADAARDASTVAVKGGEIVSHTIESMNGISRTAKESSEIISTLGGRSKEIGNIINVIDDIADQTNLLALNAAIEAARAGEQGRGFAVVADEVRKLAEKTMKATKEIGGMIKAMQDETRKAIDSMENEVLAVGDGVKLATEAGKALKDIVSRVDVVTSMIHQISTASEQQSSATEQISGDIESVASVIAETSTSAKEIAKASHEIAELASNLKKNVEMFKVAGQAEKVAHIGAARHETRLKTADRRAVA